MKNKYLMVATLSGFLMAGAAWAQMAPPFGGPDDVKYSQALWKALTKAHMVGSRAIMSTPYKGQAPHGAVLDAIDGTVKVKGTTGAVIVLHLYARCVQCLLHDMYLLIGPLAGHQRISTRRVAASAIIAAA